MADYYDPAQPFKVTDFERAKDGVSTYQILVSDPRHERLLSWLESNNQDWEPAHDSHAGFVIISQENFRVIMYRDGDLQVARVIDAENVTHNFKRTFDNKGLKFLDE